MRFITTFAATTIAFGALLYGFILAVDPYNKFGNNPFGFETKAVDFARENKFNQIEYRNKPYEAFILGSSPAHRYETAKVFELTGYKTYNYATQSATPEDYLAITRHIFSKQHPKLLILVMDFEVMNKNYETDDMFYSSPLKNYLNEIPKDSGVSILNNTYLTLDAIADSFKVVWVNNFGKARHVYLEDGDHVRDPIKEGEIKVTQFTKLDYEIDQTRVNYLKTLKKICHDHGTKLVVISSPYSIEHYQRIISDPKMKMDLEKYKLTLIDIFGTIYDFTTDETMAFNSKKYFIDSNHPTHHFSNMIMGHVFGEKNKEWPVNLREPTSI